MDLKELEDLVSTEEQNYLPSAPQKSATIEERHVRRDTISKTLQDFTKTLNILSSRYRQLPALPDATQIQWAQRMLQSPRMRFLVIDSTGTQQNADVIRIVVADNTGATLFDKVIAPQRQPDQANTTYTGITVQQLQDAPRLSDVWDEFRTLVEGMNTKVLSYGLDFLVKRLRENASYYQIPALSASGQCLMEHAKRYYETTSALKLVDVCERIGHILLQPAATALDRVQGQFALLTAMSKGVVDVHYTPPNLEIISTDTFLEEDDPF